jgi:hypothetical protein
MTEEQKEQLVELATKTTTQFVDKLKNSNEYKNADRKGKAEMEKVVKSLAKKQAKKDYTTKNKEQLLKQVIEKDEAKEKAREAAKRIVE